MINWGKELEKIFNDPLLADVTAPRKRTTSSDRLIAGFQEIVAFYEANGRLPEDNPSESTLYHKWLGIIKSDKKIERCRPFDDFGILPPAESRHSEPQSECRNDLTEEEQLDTIFNDPLLADIEDDASLGLFDIPEYMRERLNARKEAEYIGSRRPCDDFERFADGFKEIHQGLKSGKYKLIKFSIQNLKVGTYFVEDGTIGYLAAFDDEGINKHGDRDGRTRVIYENGSEADIKYKTIAKNLSVTGYSIQDCSEITTEEWKKHFTLSEGDIESGIIYVLRSKSTRTEISSLKNLYKIGFTVTSVESRIANAKNEPTYLCDDVEVVATWKVYNVKSSTFEALIHKLFASVQLQVMVNRHQPKEWFIVPFNIIEEAVQAIILKKSIKYDHQIQKIIYLENTSK